MNKILKYGALGGALASFAPLAARAQDEVVDVVDSAGLAAGFLIVWGIVAIIGLALFIFWIVMLVDVFKRKNWQDESQKNLWMIILIVSIFVGLSGLAAIIYYFVVKRALDSKGSAPQAPVQ
jgi:hypothetical protein